MEAMPSTDETPIRRGICNLPLGSTLVTDADEEV